MALGGAWLDGLRQRLPLVAFACLWSMPAPAWKVFSDRLEDADFFEHLWRMAGPLWILPAFAVWALLHVAFLWAGILIYIAFSGGFGNALRGDSVRRACLTAPLIFIPLLGAVLVLMNLYSFPGLIDARLAHTPMGQIIDLGMPALVLRIPYFAALVCALWGHSGVAKRRGGARWRRLRPRSLNRKLRFSLRVRKPGAACSGLYVFWSVPG